MRSVILSIIALVLLIAGPALAADVTLQWDANTEADLAGYRVYQGKGYELATFKRVQEVSAPLTTATIKGLDNTSHSFAVTAYNTAGLESAYSNIVTIPAAPSAPGSLKWSLTLTVTGGSNGKSNHHNGLQSLINPG